MRKGKLKLGLLVLKMPISSTLRFLHYEVKLKPGKC